MRARGLRAVATLIGGGCFPFVLGPYLVPIPLPKPAEFGPGSGELTNPTAGLQKTTGTTTLLGYGEQEVITVNTP
jgi:hypothetical protein